MECNACKGRPKTWNGSDSICAFKDGDEWSGNNWNCATVGMIRRLFDGAADGTLPDGVAYHHEADQSTGMVCAQGLESHDRPLSLWVTWYKDRGRTEQMWLMFDDKPPRRPTQSELVALAGLYTKTQEATDGQ